MSYGLLHYSVNSTRCSILVCGLVIVYFYIQSLNSNVHISCPQCLNTSKIRLCLIFYVSCFSWLVGVENSFFVVIKTIVHLKLSGILALVKYNIVVKKPLRYPSYDMIS